MSTLLTLLLALNITLAFPWTSEHQKATGVSYHSIESRRLDNSLPMLLVTNGASPEIKISIRNDLERLAMASGIPINLYGIDCETIRRDSPLISSLFILMWDGLHLDEFIIISPLGAFKGNFATTRQKTLFPSALCRPLFGLDFEELVAPRVSVSNDAPLVTKLQNVLKEQGSPSACIYVIQAPFQQCGNSSLLTLISENSKNQNRDDIYVLVPEMVNENDLSIWRKYLGKAKILPVSDYINDLDIVNRTYCDYLFNYILQYKNGDFIDGYVIYKTCENIR